MVKLWTTSDWLRPALEPLSTLHTLPAAAPQEMPAVLEALAQASGAPDAILISPRWPPRPPRHIELKQGPPVPWEPDMASLEDDAAWEEVIAGGLKTPWFWLIHGLRLLERRGQGSVVVVVPRRAPPQLEGPDEATIRATLKGFVRTTAERVRGTGLRVNLLELHQGGLDAASAQLVVSLASPETAALSGQILTASSRAR